MPWAQLETPVRPIWLAGSRDPELSALICLGWAVRTLQIGDRAPTSERGHRLLNLIQGCIGSDREDPLSRAI